jgi:hypothetical protein
MRMKAWQSKESRCPGCLSENTTQLKFVKQRDFEREPTRTYAFVASHQRYQRCKNTTGASNQAFFLRNEALRDLRRRRNRDRNDDLSAHYSAAKRVTA